MGSAPDVEAVGLGALPGKSFCAKAASGAVGKVEEMYWQSCLARAVRLLARCASAA